MGLYDDAQETRKIGIWDHLHPPEQKRGAAEWTDQPLVHAERDSPAWNAAWQGLAETIKRDRLGDGKDLDQARGGEGWQYMGSVITKTGQSHEFRHRNHPVSENREYREVITNQLDLKAPIIKPERQRGWTR